MRVLLLGGTGAMGVYLTPVLVTLGMKVFVTTRNKNTYLGDQVSIIHGDALDDHFLEGVLQSVRPDVVVDFMVYTTKKFASRKDILMQYCWQYVFISSYRVFADAPVIVEDSPRLLDVCNDQDYVDSDEYAICKARCEDILRKGKQTNWTIVRPSITFSSNRFQFGCLEANVVCFRSLQGLSVVMPGEMIKRKTTLSWAGNVAKMIAGLLGNQQAISEDFNVANSESFTWGEIEKVYTSEIGLRNVECSIEDYLAFNSPAQTIYDRMVNRVLDNAKIMRVCGLVKEDIVPSMTALRNELRAFAANPCYPSLDYRKNVYIDRLLHERTHYDTARDTWMYYSARYKSVNMVNRVFRKISSIV